MAKLKNLCDEIGIPTEEIIANTSMNATLTDCAEKSTGLEKVTEYLVDCVNAELKSREKVDTNVPGDA